MLRYWLQSVKAALHGTPSRRAPRRIRSRQQARPRPILEILEDRLAPAVFVVTNTGDNGGVNPAAGAGTGTLRQAIVDADASGAGTAANPDQIVFDIPGSGKQTILLAAALPAVTDTVDINGFTQPGSSPNTLPNQGAGAGDNAVQTIILDGSNTGGQGDGLEIEGGNSTVDGLIIQNFYNGIHLTANGNDLIEGDYLTNNNNTDVLVDNVPNNTIGGTAPAARNVIVGSSIGITIQGNTATGNTVQGNYLGTDGKNLESNGYASIVVSDASGNTIGGATSGAGNVITGNNNGIVIIGDGPGTDNGTLPPSSPALGPANENVIQGNYIGTDPTGSIATTGSRSGAGIWLLGYASGNTIGGTSAAARNVISGWSVDVQLESLTQGDCTGNILEGNYIGTDVTGTTALTGPGYAGFGIALAASGNTIGGTTLGAGNLISGSQADLVVAGDSNVIEGNLIGTDASGTSMLPNGAPSVGAAGIGIGGSNNTVGGSSPGAANTIAYIPGGDGVQVSGTGNTIEGNAIHDNGGAGIEVDGGTGERIEGNAIYGNAGLGIDLGGFGLGAIANVPGGPFTGTDTSTISNVTGVQSGSDTIITGTLTGGLPNSIYYVRFLATSNQGPTTFLGWSAIATDASGNSDFRTDFQDTDLGPGWTFQAWSVAPPHGGPNYLQNYPVVTSVTSSGSDTSVSGTLNGQANTTFHVEFFANPTDDPTGYGQGQTLLVSTSVTTDGAGKATFNVDLPGGNLAGQWLTATATDPGGNTSEFSTDVPILAPNETFAQFLQAGLPQSSTTANSLTIVAGAGTTPSTVIQAVNGLTNVTQPVTITLDLGGATWSTNVSVDPPPNVNFVIENGTLDPDTPALTVAGGQVSLVNCTLTTTGNAPTLLVTGGNVTLSNDVIVQASTTSTDPAIAVTGGTINLGTAVNPGNNILSVNSTGDLVSNTSGNAISAAGNTFVVGGTVATAASLNFPSLVVSDAGGSYTGSAFAATVTVTGENGTPGISLEGVTPTLDYLRINADGSTTDLGANAPVNAGNYEVIASFAGSTDYSAASASTTFTIAQAALTVNTTSSLMLVGNNPPPLTGSVNGTPFTGSINYTTPQGDTITITLGTSATSTSPVGQYGITATLSGAASGNYVINPNSMVGTMYVVSLGTDPTDPTHVESVTFWDNKGNAKSITAADLSSLDALNLVNQGGSAFDPHSVAQLEAWLSVSPNATPAYQLAVQLAALDLNVLAGNVQATDLVFAGGLLPYASADDITGLSSGGFIDVQSLLQAANAALALVNPGAPAHDPNTAYEQALTRVLQSANGNSDFV